MGRFSIDVLVKSPLFLTNMDSENHVDSTTIDFLGKNIGEAHYQSTSAPQVDFILKYNPEHPVAPQDIDLFHTVARVCVSPDAAVGFAPAAEDIVFEPDLDRLNFQEIPVGTMLGRINGGGLSLLDVRDEEGREVSLDYFDVKEGQLCLRRSVMPSMLTRDVDIIRQDCLCYLMERYKL